MSDGIEPYRLHQETFDYLYQEWDKDRTKPLCADAVLFKHIAALEKEIEELKACQSVAVKTANATLSAADLMVVTMTLAESCKSRVRLR